ncbi:hypothetical protein H7I41_16275 [Mycobacterium manitobense]|uniref:Uncharacterized protein n=1 Tax=[Mycobacterium] manitobense TaxID=190147 RepID=A0A9X2YBE6_9MYCO|nr:hypothetical protein [[Mycobacterium] manitobense]
MKRVFSGHIAGVGSQSGHRLVVGSWQTSPFGAFTDVMVQRAGGRERSDGGIGTDDERVLLAPTREIADFVSTTYAFDRVLVGPVRAELTDDRLTVAAPNLDLRIDIGEAAPLDRLLRLVPARIAVAPWWLRAIDPVASRMVAGVHTAGTAGNGRREYYGVRRSRRIVGVSGRLDGEDLGALAPLRPPVRFGFASAPAEPQIVSVTTTIVETG